MSLSQSLAQTTLVLGNRIIKDLISGDAIKLEFANDTTTSFHGNYNKIVAINSNRLQATITLRLIAGSDDDIFMADAVKDIINNPFLPNGSFTRVFKREGDNAESKEIYNVSGPTIQKSNSNGIVVSVSATEDAIVNEYIIDCKATRV